jgi:hypothetical protein
MRSAASKAADASHAHAPDVPGHGQAGENWLHYPVGWAFSWLSPLALAAAAVLFGAAGLLADGAGPIALIIAIVAGFIGAALVRMLMNSFVRASVEPLSLHAEGAIGRINATIRAGGTGEVVYTLEGLQRSAAARSVDGTPLPRGLPVVILRREHGVAVVEPLDPLEEISLGGNDILPAKEASTGEVFESRPE